MPALPGLGTTNWMDWAAGVHDAAEVVTEGRLTDADLRAAFGTVTSVAAYGAVGDGTTDDTAAVEAAMSACAAAGGGVVFLPEGTYLLSALTLRNRVAVRGVSPEATIIEAKPGGTSKGLVQIEAGPAQFATLENVQLLGAMTAGQGAVYANSVGDGGTPDHGGWWSGGMRNVRIDEFAGPCVWLRANGTDGLLPHQYLVLEQLEARATGTYEALLISGQVGQVAAINGYYVGPEADNDDVPAVRVCREIADDRSTVVSDASPYAISFLQTSFQSNGIGLSVDRTLSVSLMGPHFEECGKGIVADNGGAVAVVGANMQLAGANTAGTGVGLQALNNAVIRAFGTSFFGTVDKHFDGNVRATGTNYTDTDMVGPITSGLTKQTAVQAGNYVDLADATTVRVNASATPLRTIRSWKGPGESVYLKPLGGTITLEQGGTAPGSIADSNLTFPLTVPQDAVVHLVRGDLAGHWNIVSVTGL